MTAGDTTFTRRAALRAAAVGAAALATAAALPAGAFGEADFSQPTPLELGTYGFNADWRFGGVYSIGDEAAEASERGYETVALPHTVTHLSWSNWRPADWERIWIYRKHLAGSALSGGRVFVDFQGVMTSATVYLNGTAVGFHQGGYLPFTVELTSALGSGDNVLAVVVDGTLQNVPPNKATAEDGAGAIDYLQPAGIYRDAALRIEPPVFVSDVFAKPVDVLTAPRLDALVTVDASTVPSGPVTVTAVLLDGTEVIGQATQQLTLTAAGPTETLLSITNLSGIGLWSPESPQLYNVHVTVSETGGASDVFVTRTGFREAVFQPDGFYLNGSRYQIFGLTRHQIFPYTGMAAPERVQRRDAEILRTELNCNMVRCSHYPQSDWFLDACDELGLMVWEEPPGWGYVNNTPSTGPAFQALVQQNVRDMIVRDRSRPSVVLWATRLNETSSLSNHALYAETNAIAAQYDGTRQTTGAMNHYTAVDFNQQVFGYDDYTHYPPDTGVDYLHNNAALRPPIKDAEGNPMPYLIAESVGAIMGAPSYRWIDPPAALSLQAKLHAEAHNQAGVSGYAGLLACCCVDYTTITGTSVHDAPRPNGSRVWRTIKSPGVLDFFRAAKPGAALYRAQSGAEGSAGIYPAFFWDFSAASPSGPGADALLFTDCAQVEATVSNGLAVPVIRLNSSYQNLTYPPFRLDLSQVDPSGSPDLVINGLDGNGKVLTTLRMSSNPARDGLRLTVDDNAIAGDGTDATRFTVQAVDCYGNPRRTPGGQVTLTLTGSAATLVSERTFPFDMAGGSGGGFIRSRPDGVGIATLIATHPILAPQGVSQTVTVGAVTPPAFPAGAGGPPTAAAPASPATNNA